MPSRSSLARLLRIACLSHLAMALAWLAWRWDASPLQAFGGAALILFVAPAVLAIELAIVSRIGHSHAAPAPTAVQLAAAWLSESAHFFRTFYWRQPFRWRRDPDHLDAACAGRTGLVLVHGFMCNRGFWNAWMQGLREHGHAFVAVNLEPVFASITEYAPAIDDAVARVTRLTGRPPVLRGCRATPGQSSAG